VKKLGFFLPPFYSFCHNHLHTSPLLLFPVLSHAGSRLKENEYIIHYYTLFWHAISSSLFVRAIRLFRF